ncbi:FluC/FEX family fluoride channel [Georgenia satyanarayanai]|uniref:FluC/FEX family fluoride channel n=1 Tax=Georgenia satyanarayanai TaxID=860221 RepID=UPI00186B0811|nr:CrcB family protein [Georgenia satyanarayanai]
MPRPRERLAADSGVAEATAGRRRRPKAGLDVPLVIAAGGALGAVARYGIALWVPHVPGAFPWATIAANVSGCLVIGVLMVLLTELGGRPHRLVRPFLGVGVLGGFTTFSTYTVDIHQMLQAGAPHTALVYLFATLAAALVAVEVGMATTRLAVRSAARKGSDR